MSERGALADQVAVVTGSTRGIGLAIARRFVAEGARVAVNGRDRDGCERAATELGDRARPAPGDVGDPRSVDALVEETAETWGRLDVLVNNAGVALDNYVTKVTDERWDRTLATNLSGAFYALRAVVPHMKSRGRGSIVNLVSWAGLRGNVGQVPYSAAKAGLVGMTLAAAKELAKFGIRVNALSPSVRTDMSTEMTDEMLERVVRRTPLHRLGTLDEVAEAALFLASDRSSFTTGDVLDVDGGLHLS